MQLENVFVQPVPFLGWHRAFLAEFPSLLLKGLYPLAVKNCIVFRLTNNQCLRRGQNPLKLDAR